MELAVAHRRHAGALDLARARVTLTYLWRHHRWPDLDDPEYFTELVQRRKLEDRDLRFVRLADKVAVKAHVADLLGTEWVIPTLWHGTALPDAPCWAAPFVVKSRHGCNQNAFVHRLPADWHALRAKAERWAARPYGTWLDEWLYDHIERGMLVEPFVGEGKRLPIDYKLYVFGGRVEYVQVHLGRGAHHRWIVFDRAWKRVSASSRDADPPRPASLAAMIDGAEVLGRGFDFVRIDLYEIERRPVFGEMTFYPGSGLDRFAPTSLDHEMGSHWRRARDG